MGRRRFAFAGFLAMLAMMMAAPAQAMSPDGGKLFDGRLAAGASQTVELTAGAGDYIRGSLSVSDEASISLQLVDRQGQPLRQLADGREGSAEFHFVLPPDGGALRLSARGTGGAFRLSINRQVPAAEQGPPPPVLESPRMARLAQEITAGASTEVFWAEIEASGAPLVEPLPNGKALVTFLARGARHNVRLLAAPSGDHEELFRLQNSDVWFRSFVVPNTTRMSYQLAYDVPEFSGSPRDRRLAILATAKADPLNHHPWPRDAVDAYAQSSILELAEAPAQPWINERGNPRGTLQTMSFESRELGNRRTITLYRPPGFDPGNRDTVLLILFDGREYLERVDTPRMLDNMIAEGALPPVVTAFVANPDRQARARELPGNALFADILAGDMLARIAAETGLTPDPARTVLAGSSYGGLASATIALRHPEKFGNVLSLSGSFWWSPEGTPPERSEHVAAEVARLPRQPVRFFLSAGLFEVAKGGTGGILETSRHLRDVLDAKGYDTIYAEYAGGHDYLVWRGALADGLQTLFGRRSGRDTLPAR
jgi:enterochelin esterase-like enzyme